MAIVYDKGDGSTPSVIEAKPLIELEGAGTEAQRNEVPRELNELYNPAVTGPGADRNSPFGRINATESELPNSYNNYSSKVVIAGDNLGSKWDAIQGTIGFVNDSNFAYLPLIQNSNSFAALALQRAGLQVPDTSFFVGGTDQTSNMYVPAMGNPLLIHQNPNGSSLENVTGTVVGELDGSITILALANDPNQAGVIKVSANINSKDQTTEVETANSDGTSTKTVFDTGAEPWSSETSAFDAYQRLQSQRVVFDGGSQQVKEYDPNNTHAYNELDVAKAADGKITGAQVTLDPTVAAAGIGQIFGSAIGRALAPNDPFARIAISTVAGTIGMKFAQVLSASLSVNAEQINISSILSTAPKDLSGAAAGAVASFLVAELGEQLHLTGFSAALFSSAVGGFAGSLAQQIARDGIGVLAGAAWENALNAGGISVGGTLGSILGI